MHALPLTYALPGEQPVVNLQDVAAKQKAVMYCILAYITLVVANIFTTGTSALIVSLLAIAVSITASVFIFRLSLTVYSTAAGILLGLLTLVPLIGLIVLLIVNNKATTILKDCGVRVGFLGADPASIPADAFGQR